MTERRTKSAEPDPQPTERDLGPVVDLRDDCVHACEVLYNDLARLGGYLARMGIGERDHYPAEARRTLAGWSRRVAQSAANINVAIGMLLTRLDNG